MDRHDGFDLIEWIFMGIATVVVLLALAWLYGCSVHLHLGGKYYRCDDQKGGITLTFPEDGVDKRSDPGEVPGAVSER